MEILPPSASKPNQIPVVFGDGLRGQAQLEETGYSAGLRFGESA